MDFLSVSGHDNLVRDPHTNSIINKNMTEYNEYVSRRENREKENLKIQSLENEVANMKDDLSEIKYLLRSLVNESRQN